MKELWTTNPFHLMNSPFAEMGYSSSEPNIVPAHLLLAIRTPLAAPPRAASASPLRATRRPPPRTIRSLPAQHLLTQTDVLIPLCAQAVGITGGDLPASALLTPCAPSTCFPRNIRRALCVPPADSPPSACQRTAQHPSAPCMPSARQLTAMPAGSPQTIRHRTAQHPPTPARHPLTPCRQSAGTNRCP